MTDLNEFTVIRDYGPPATPPSEAVLASARADLMAELSAHQPKPAPVRRRVRVSLRVAAAVAAAVVVGIVVAVGQFGGGTEVPRAADSGPVRLVEFRAPALPPELNPVPDGLRVSGLTGEPGWIGRFYNPVDSRSQDRIGVLASSRGHNPQNIDEDHRETTYDGKKAYVAELEAYDGADASTIVRTVRLSWESAPGTWTILSGSGRFASEEAVRALAGTLVPTTDELELSIDVAPEGWELAAFKQGVTTLRDPASPDRELTVSLRDDLVPDFAEGTMVPVERSVPVTINGGRGELLALTDGTWMLQAPLPDGRAFLLQAAAGFTQRQVVEVASGVHV
jgi:hypothetical protein